ncbi:MAG: hypothetical protein WCP39_03145 [Chlamydiota bacterium]
MTTSIAPSSTGTVPASGGLINIPHLEVSVPVAGNNCMCCMKFCWTCCSNIAESAADTMQGGVPQNQKDWLAYITKVAGDTLLNTAVDYLPTGGTKLSIEKPLNQDEANLLRREVQLLANTGQNVQRVVKTTQDALAQRSSAKIDPLAILYPNGVPPVSAPPTGVVVRKKDGSDQMFDLQRILLSIDKEAETQGWPKIKVDEIKSQVVKMIGGYQGTLSSAQIQRFWLSIASQLGCQITLPVPVLGKEGLEENPVIRDLGFPTTSSKSLKGDQYHTILDAYGIVDPLANAPFVEGPKQVNLMSLPAASVTTTTTPYPAKL